MGMTNNPDETVIVDFAVFRRRMVEHLKADNTFCKNDVRLVRLFDEPFTEMSMRFRVRQTFEKFMRNGGTRRSMDAAREIGLTVVVDNDDRVTNLIPWPETKMRPKDGTPPDAA